jgi:hypothetical protein
MVYILSSDTHPIRKPRARTRPGGQSSPPIPIVPPAARVAAAAGMPPSIGMSAARMHSAIPARAHMSIVPMMHLDMRGLVPIAAALNPLVSMPTIPVKMMPAIVVEIVMLVPVAVVIAVEVMGPVVIVPGPIPHIAGVIRPRQPDTLIHPRISFVHPYIPPIRTSRKRRQAQSHRRRRRQSKPTLRCYCSEHDSHPFLRESCGKERAMERGGARMQRLRKMSFAANPYVEMISSIARP